MTLEYLNLRFLVRGGTAANLATVNEVPLKRELVIETDTGKMKLGDGSTPYNALPYLPGGGGEVDVDVAMRAADGYIQFSSDGGTTWENVIALESLRGPAGESGTGGVLPMVNGETPPVLLYGGNQLIYARIE